MIKKSICITERHEKWLKEETEKLGISESDIIRRTLDEMIKNDNQKSV